MGIAIVVMLLAFAVAWRVRSRRSTRSESEPAYLLLAAQVQEAAKRPLAEAIEAVPTAASDGLGVILGSWVRWALELGGDTPVGLAANRSCWAGRVGRDRKLLVFSTGGTFTDEDIAILEHAAALVDLLLIHSTA